MELLATISTDRYSKQVSTSLWSQAHRAHGGASQVQQEDRSWPQQPQQCVKCGPQHCVKLPCPSPTYKQKVGCSISLLGMAPACPQAAQIHAWPLHPSAKGLRLCFSSATSRWRRAKPWCNAGCCTLVSRSPRSAFCKKEWFAVVGWSGTPQDER